MAVVDLFNKNKDSILYMYAVGLSLFNNKIYNILSNSVEKLIEHHSE